jgi:hypothetical protein
MFAQRHTRFALATLGLACAASAGCASTGATAQNSNPTAAVFAQSRCGSATDAPAVAEILSGKSVESVTPLYLNVNNKTSVTVLEGAAVYVRPAPGESAEWLARALECHSAKIAAQGVEIGAGNDPFVSSGSIPTISVRSGGDSFRIEITSRVSDDARDILARAQALGTPTSVFALRHQ